MPRMIVRHATSRVEALLGSFPVVAITGARQVGKSTLGQQLVKSRGGTYVTLDDISVRSHALEDPRGFVAGQRGGLCVIDEIQLAPELLRAIKIEVDRDRTPGRFLITGSANLLRMRSVTESLAGRSAWVELLPLTWSELAGRPRSTALDALFEARTAADFVARLKPSPRGAANQIRLRAVAGGMPGTLHLAAETRGVWYESYRQTFLERDLRQISQIASLPEFNRLLSLAALRSANLLNKSGLAADAGLSHATLRRYLDILEVAYQFFELTPYFANLGKRLVKTPKLYGTDVGLVAHLAAIRSWDEAVAAGRSGALFETWAVNEIRTIEQLSARPSVLSFWRTSTGSEVDLVLERGTAIAAIEFKASATVTRADTAPLRELRGLLGKRFRLGAVAYLGDSIEVLDPTLCLVPVAALL